MIKTLTPEEALKLIRTHIRASRSREDVAQKHGVSVSTINKVYLGTRSAPSSLLDDLGLQKVVTYTSTRDDA